MVALSLETRPPLNMADDFHSASSSVKSVAKVPAKPETLDPQTNNLKKWVDVVGLELNPFEKIDAGSDPLIPFYLIDHNQFEHVSGDQPSLVFAPAGGGKTAFRVRLARECRAGRNGRRIFPIVFKPTVPGDSDEDKEHSTHRQRTDLLHYASKELFLHLAYYPYALDEMDSEIRKTLLQMISWDLDFPISYYLGQMEDAGSIEPFLAAFDPTAGSLPNPPGREDINYLSKKLSQYAADVEKPEDEKRLDCLFELLFHKLKYEAIYILVDGVDAFLETVHSPERALAAISWFIDNTLLWMKNRIFVKFFLPDEVYPIAMKIPAFRLLTLKSKIAIIKWDADKLSEVIRQRLQEASGGKYDSFAAISDRALRASGRTVEEILIADLRRHKKSSPRSLIRAANQLITNHIQGKQVREKLTPQDLKAVREWIRNEYSAKT
jgi:hypothetical protein